MRILAVIPARAASKGIPNKNIRIPGGHPLIYYSIRNAMKSKYIADVIVTTDNSDVTKIASEMETSLKNRAENLCTDQVTLDSVMYDAIPQNIEWD